MNKTLLLLCSALFSFSLSAQLTWQWGYEAGGPGNDLGLSISTTSSGNSYVTGRFHATASFGNNTISSYGGPDIFVAKYNPLGVCIWARNAGSIDTQDNYGDEGDGIDIDTAGNCYVTGNFKGQATFGATVIGSAMSTDRNIFLAKYDASGNLLWVDCPVANGNNNYARSVAVDAAGNAYITGFLGGGSNTFGAFTLTGAGGYVVKYNAAGTVIYATKLGINGAVDLYGIDIDAAGSAYVTGYLSSSEVINSQTYSATGMRDAVLIKIDAAGNFQWLRQSTGFNGSICSSASVCSDGANGIFLCGEFDNTAIFGTDTLSAGALSPEIFIARYDTAGNAVWAIQSTSPSFSMPGNAFAITSAGNNRILITGVFPNDLIIGGDTLLNNGFGSNTYIIAFDATTALYQFGIASTGQNPGAYGHGISTDNNGAAYICGYDKAPVVFGMFTTSFIGGEDLFIAKIGPEKPNAIAEQEDQTSLRVFYSAADHTANISLGTSTAQQGASCFVLYDLSGREVKRSAITPGYTSVAVGDLANGIYCWKVEGAVNVAGKIMISE